MTFTGSTSEAVYLGDFVQDLSRFPARIVQINRNNQAARAALAKARDGRTDLVFRDPRQ